MASNGLKIAIVGGGLAGLAAAMKIAEAGHEVDLISVVPVKRSHSVCAQGGINGAVNTKGEGDSPAKHLDDTVYGGDFLVNQPPVKRMCDMAPQIIYLFDRMGVPFSRTKEGLMDFRRFGGTLHHRTAFAGASTGQQLLYALDEQVRKWEVQGKVNKFEGWEMLSLVLDDHQVCRGLVAMNLQTLELKAFQADAVIMATGGPGLIFGKSTNSMTCTGSAVKAGASGSRETWAIPAVRAIFPKASATIFLRKDIRHTAISCRAILRRARSLRSALRARVSAARIRSILT